jgi:hypothetical protein
LALARGAAGACGEEACLSNVENYKTTTLITRTFVRVESPCIV